jgi:hypothetical protein
MAWLVCAYYTKDPIYSKHAVKLIESLQTFNIPYDVTPIDSYNDWYKGMQHKPHFLQEMLAKHSPHSVVYVDADAIFLKYPELFDTIQMDMPKVNVAAHVLDHTKFLRKNCAKELLSGTIFLRNTEETSIILREWIQELDKNPRLWDQCGLANVLKKHSFYNLPEEYCTIFDYMSTVKDPVIKHFQASREARRALRPPKKRVRQVDNNNCVVRISRIHN